MLLVAQLTAKRQQNVNRAYRTFCFPFPLAMIAKGLPLPTRGAALGQYQQVLRELSIGTTGRLATRGVWEWIRYAIGAG